MQQARKALANNCLNKVLQLKLVVIIGLSADKLHSVAKKTNFIHYNLIIAT